MSYAGRMLNGVHLVNFGNHRDTKLYFGPITALVGANGSGKTTVMRSLQALNDGGFEVDLRRAGSKGESYVGGSWPDPNDSTLDIGMLTDFEGAQRLTRKRLSEEEPIWMPDQPNEPLMTTWDKTVSYIERLSRDDFTSVAIQPGEIRNLDHAFLPWRCRYFKTNARALQRPSYAELQAPRLNENGSSLAAVLSYLMTAEPDRFAQIMDAFRKVVPLVKRVRARPVSIKRIVKQTVTVNKVDRVYDETQEVPGQALIFDMISGQGLPAPRISEGTLVTLAILTLVYGEDDADMIMLDDVELGLHPKAQRDLMRQLKAIQQTNPKLQILVSTHSPYVVDELAPEDVWLFTTDKEGCAVSARLSDHPDAERALEVLSTGEFWSAEGEEWVAARVEEKAKEAPESVVREEE